MAVGRLQIAAAAVVAVVLLGRHCNADEHHTLDTPAGKQEAPQITAEEISKVYMNCLIEVDKTLAVLAGRAKHKAVESEAESQRAFCANRKRDCQDRPGSVECRTFAEEFKNIELSTGGAVKR